MRGLSNNKKNRHHFPNVYVMYVRFSLPFPSDSEILHTGWLMLIGSDLDYTQCHWWFAYLSCERKRPKANAFTLKFSLYWNMSSHRNITEMLVMHTAVSVKGKLGVSTGNSNPDPRWHRDSSPEVLSNYFCPALYMSLRTSKPTETESYVF